MEFDDNEDFQELDQSDDERIAFIIERCIKTIIDENREQTERITALEILGKKAYISDVRGVMLIGKYLPFILSLIVIDQKNKPPGSIICRVFGTISEIGFEMSEIQEVLYRINGYEIIISHIHNSYKPDDMSQENEVICKWATYCLCCCLGDVLEPLEYVKGELTTSELKWLASTTWEASWGRNWGLCLAKLLGKTKSFQKPMAFALGQSDEDMEGLVDDSKIKEIDPASLSPFGEAASTSTPPSTPPRNQSPEAAKRKNVEFDAFYKFSERGQRDNYYPVRDPALRDAFISSKYDTAIGMQPWAFNNQDTISETSGKSGIVIPAEESRDKLSPSDATSLFRPPSSSKISLMPQTPQKSLTTLSSGEVRLAKKDGNEGAKK